jgi:hypothetical protein
MRTSHPTPRFIPLAILAGLLAAVLLLAACAPETDLTDPTSDRHLPPTPDALLEQFATVYQARDLEGYARLLHEDFIFSFQACDVEKLGLSRDHYTRDDELAAAARMFSGKAHVKDDGVRVDPILEIRFRRFARLGAWEDARDRERPGLLRATYEVDVVMDRGAAGCLAIRGTCVFYAVGNRDTGYRLIGWVDRTGGC